MSPSDCSWKWKWNVTDRSGRVLQSSARISSRRAQSMKFRSKSGARNRLNCSLISRRKGDVIRERHPGTEGYQTSRRPGAFCKPMSRCASRTLFERSSSARKSSSHNVSRRCSSDSSAFRSNSMRIGRWGYFPLESHSNRRSRRSNGGLSSQSSTTVGPYRYDMLSCSMRILRCPCSSSSSGGGGWLGEGE